MKVKEERKRVDSDRDMQKKTLAGLRGASELELFRILEEDIKVKFTHRGGDFAMGGNDCRKVLKNHEKLVTILESDNDQERFSGLFARLEASVDILYEIEPLQVVNFTVEEARLSELKFEKEGEVNTQARA